MLPLGCAARAEGADITFLTARQGKQGVQLFLAVLYCIHEQTPTLDGF